MRVDPNGVVEEIFVYIPDTNTVPKGTDRVAPFSTRPVLSGPTGDQPTLQGTIGPRPALPNDAPLLLPERSSYNQGAVNFKNITGVHDFMRRIPDNATKLPWKNIPGGAEQGVKYTWVDELGNKFQARAHSMDYSAPSGSNASQGWIYRVEMRPGGTGKWHPMDLNGKFHKPNVVNPNSPMYDGTIANDTHIPFTKRGQ